MVLLALLVLVQLVRAWAAGVACFAGAGSAGPGSAGAVACFAGAASAGVATEKLTIPAATSSRNPNMLWC